MNIGMKPVTIEKIKRVEKLRKEGLSVNMACKRVGLSKVYYWKKRKLYVDDGVVNAACR